MAWSSLPVLLTPPLLSTSNPAAFVSSSPYQGKSIVFTGNHTPLSISDIGTISLSSRSGNVLHLNDAMLVPKVLILFLIRNSGTVNYPYITFSELRIPLGPLTQKARHSLTALINREQVQGQVFLASICWFADVTDSVSTKGRCSWWCHGRKRTPSRSHEARVLLLRGMCVLRFVYSNQWQFLPALLK